MSQTFIVIALEDAAAALSPGQLDGLRAALAACEEHRRRMGGDGRRLVICHGWPEYALAEASLIWRTELAAKRIEESGRSISRAEGFELAAVASASRGIVEVFGARFGAAKREFDAASAAATQAAASRKTGGQS